jgi:hypothetical protein
MYLLSVLAVLVVVSVVPAVLSDPLNQPIGDFTIPSWIKNTAGWWADDKIPDSVFIQGIQFLIKEEIITVQIPAVDSVVEEIPGWVKNTAGWWAEDKIQDITFVAAVRYLVSQGIVYVEREQVEEPVEEVEEITDFYMEVNSGSCTYCVSWAYVGKEYYFQIETYDEKRGNYIDGVEINVKIISKGGELRHNFGQVTTEDGFYKNSITIPSMDWYAENTLFVTGEYYGTEKTIEKEFTVFKKGYSADPSTSNTAGSCTEVSPKSVASEETLPTGIAFSDDGRKMFIVGWDGDVNEYTLAGPYCLGTASFVDSFSVASQEGQPTGIAFSNDGRKMFIVGSDDDEVNEYTLSENFDVSTASFVDAFSVASQDEQPSGVAFSNDGLKMFIAGNANNKVNEYTLSEDFDVSTASFVDAFSVASQETTPRGVAFSNDGLKMFIVGNGNDKVYEYTLSENFDVSTASFVDAFSVASQDTAPLEIAFDPSGRYMFILGSNDDDVTVYKLSENFDVSTAVVQSG